MKKLLLLLLLINLFGCAGFSKPITGDNRYFGTDRYFDPSESNYYYGRLARDESFILDVNNYQDLMPTFSKLCMNYGGIDMQTIKREPPQKSGLSVNINYKCNKNREFLTDKHIELNNIHQQRASKNSPVCESFTIDSQPIFGVKAAIMREKCNSIRSCIPIIEGQIKKNDYSSNVEFESCVCKNLGGQQNLIDNKDANRYLVQRSDGNYPIYCKNQDALVLLDFYRSRDSSRRIEFYHLSDYLGFSALKAPENPPEVINKNIDELKIQCEELGFKPDTDKFKDCVVELM